ncbi:hypothetical protein KR054_000574, partial [Drosophila jambulina]
AQLERELENELDEMPPVQDLDEDEDDDDDDDDDEDDDAYDDYDLILVPGQRKTTEQVPGNSSDEEDKKKELEQKKKQEQDLARKQHRDAILQRVLQSPVAGGAGGDDVTTIEIMSSDDDDDEDDDDSESELESGQQKPKAGQSAATINDSSDDEVGVIEDSDSDEENDNDFTSSGDSDSDAGTANQLERAFEDLLAQPQKQFAQLVKLSEIAFKLNDLAKIELAVQTLQNDATVPAHIWLKYLKARQVVTQTPEECKEFDEKCATALGYHYNIPLAEFIVGYLEDQDAEHQNRALWAKLLADYDVERPDYGLRLSAKLSTLADETEREAFEELLKKHCVTWKIPAEQRETINEIVTKFKLHLEEMKLQHSDWDWAKLHSKHVEQVLALNLDEDIQNAIIRFIFERSVSKFPTADALWLAYMRFIQGEGDEDEDEADAELAAKRASRLGKGFLLSTVLDLAKRAVRCRPSIRLNHKLLVLMERADFDQSAVDEQIRGILRRIVEDMTMTVELHLDYLAYRVRNTNASDEEQATSLRAAFFRIWEELSALYGDQADSRYEVLQLWAQVEYSHLGSPANGSNIWRQIMGYPGSSQRGLLWLGFAQMESEYNAGQGTRDILREALNQPYLADGLMVQELYRRYERCYGTYETIAACQALELPPDFLGKQYQAPRQHRSQPQQQQATRQQQRSQQQGQAQTQDQAQTLAQSPLNRQQRRRQAHEMTMGNQKQQQQQVPKVPAEKTVTKPHPVKPAASEVRESHLKYSPHLETNKVFVRNLHPACTKEELQELFQPFGHVKDVRLVHKQKQMRGIAYVEFEKPEEAQKAVAERNGHELHGLAIFVAISNPPPKTGPPGGPAASGGGDGGGMAKVAPKRRVVTSLIPTTVVRQEAAAVAAKKRRIELSQ